MSAVLSAAQAASPSTAWDGGVKARQVLSTRLIRLGGGALARAIHKDESHASRILSGERGCTIAEFAVLLDLAGLKLVDKDKLCVSRDQHEFMRRVTARVIANEEMSARLFEDAE